MKPEEIVRSFRAAFARQHIEEPLDDFSEDAAVLTERVDHPSIGNKQVSLRVMGNFGLSEEGKLSAWRDDFDMAQLSAQIR